MEELIKKIAALKAEVKAHLDENELHGFAHAGQVLTGLGHAADNAKWLVEAVAAKAEAEAKAKKVEEKV